MNLKFKLLLPHLKEGSIVTIEELWIYFHNFVYCCVQSLAFKNLFLKKLQLQTGFNQIHLLNTQQRSTRMIAGALQWILKATVSICLLKPSIPPSEPWIYLFSSVQSEVDQPVQSAGRPVSAPEGRLAASRAAAALWRRPASAAVRDMRKAGGRSGNTHLERHRGDHGDTVSAGTLHHSGARLEGYRPEASAACRSGGSACSRRNTSPLWDGKTHIQIDWEGQLNLWCEESKPKCRQICNNLLSVFHLLELF